MAIIQANERPQERKESLFDKISKGVSLANDVLTTVDRFEQRKKRPELEEQAKQDKALERRYKEAQAKDLEGRNPLEWAKLNKDKAPRGASEIMAKMGAEEKNKLGAIAEGFASLDQMQKAMGSGYGPRRITPDTAYIGGLVSDDPYSSAERVLTEVVGRLQSGGAIGVEEEKRFRALSPRPGDSADEKSRKLEAQKRFLENKLTAYGINTGDLPGLGFKLEGFKPESREKGVSNMLAERAAPQAGSLQDRAAQKLQERMKARR